MNVGDKKPLLLVVDDNPDDVRDLAGVLDGRYELLVAVDGQKALEVASAFLPDLILLDVIMPGMGGMRFVNG